MRIQPHTSAVALPTQRSAHFPHAHRSLYVGYDGTAYDQGEFCFQWSARIRGYLFSGPSPFITKLLDEGQAETFISHLDAHVRHMPASPASPRLSSRLSPRLSPRLSHTAPSILTVHPNTHSSSQHSKSSRDPTTCRSF